MRHMFFDAADPLVGFCTVPATDAVYTYSSRSAIGAYEDVTAYEAVYSDPDPNGYTFSILVL